MGGVKCEFSTLSTYATPSPAAPPKRDSTIPSLTICRTNRYRLAPTDSRIANSRRRFAPRAICMFAKFMHASPMTKLIKARKNPINAGFTFRGIGTLVPAGSNVTRLPFSFRIGNEASCSSSCRVIPSSAASADSSVTPRRQTHDGQEFLGLALMQYVVGQLGRCGCWRSDGHKQLRRLHPQRPVKILRRNSHNGRRLSVQMQCLPHGIGRAAEPVLPETVADHHHRRIASLVHLRTEHAPHLRFHAQH